MDPSLLVVVPTFQRPKGLERALRSVLCDPVRPLTALVVDDGSSPPAELPESLQKDSRVWLLRVPFDPELKRTRCTVARAMNHAILAAWAAGTQYITWCTDSAELQLDGLWTLVEYLESKSQVSAAWGHVQHGDATVDQQGPIEEWRGPSFMRRLAQGNFIDLSGTVMRARAFASFDDSAEAWPDIDWRLWKKQAELDHEFHRLPVHVVTKHSSATNMGVMLARGQTIADVLATPREEP